LNHDELFTTGAADEGPSRPPDERTSSRSGTNPYADLKRIVKNNGLLDRQPTYFGGKIALSLCLLAVGLALLPILGGTWLQLANAVYLAFVFVQVSFLAHDFGHRQFSFRTPLEEHLGDPHFRQPAARLEPPVVDRQAQRAPRPPEPDGR